MAHDVFISHSSNNRTVATAACAALESSGIRCWIAPRDVLPGRSYSGEITRAIQQSRAFVLIFSQHSNNSEQVLREVQLAANSHLHIVQFPQGQGLCHRADAAVLSCSLHAELYRRRRQGAGLCKTDDRYRDFRCALLSDRSSGKSRHRSHPRGVGRGETQRQFEDRPFQLDHVSRSFSCSLNIGTSAPRSASLHGLNPIFGLAGAGAGLGGSMMSITRWRMVTMAAS